MATASLATRGPVLPAPAESHKNGALLDASMEGVPFPYWGDSFQWEAVGARDDKIKDRPAKTVYYENGAGVQAAYTILGGDAVGSPSGSHKLAQNGITLWVLEHDGRRIVSWQRGSHTCVLSAPVSVAQDALLALASWKGNRMVP